MDEMEPDRTVSRMEGQDLALVAWETPDRPMEVGGMLTFRLEPGSVMPTLHDVREAIRPTLVREPRLHQRILRRRLRAPVWESARSFALRQHVRHARVPRDGVTALLERPLPDGHPPWSIWVLPGHPDSTSFTLVLKAHHALLDGDSAISFFERLFGVSSPGGRGARRPLRALRPRLGEALHLVRSLVQRGPETPLTGPVAASERHHVFELDDALLRERAKANGATRFEAVLAALAEGVDNWLEGETGRGSPDGLRAFCPVALGGSEEGLGNRIAPWIVPLGRIDGTQRAERSASARGGAWLAGWVRGPGAWLARLGMGIAARRRAFHLVLSQVPGLSPRNRFLGARLQGFVPWVPLLPGLRVSLGVCRVGPRLFVGVREAFPDPDQGARFVRSVGDVLTERFTRRSHAA